jgi:hypothetical protein
MKFKVGDRVKRIIGCYKNMNIGDTDIIIKLDRFGDFDLKDFGIGHAKSSFVFAKRSLMDLEVK